MDAVTVSAYRWLILSATFFCGGLVSIVLGSQLELRTKPIASVLVPIAGLCFLLVAFFFVAWLYNLAKIKAFLPPFHSATIRQLATHKLIVVLTNAGLPATRYC